MFFFFIQHILCRPRRLHSDEHARVTCTMLDSTRSRIEMGNDFIEFFLRSFTTSLLRSQSRDSHHHHHHQSLNHEGRWGTTDDFATSFLHFPLFTTALWDLANSRPVHSLMLSSHLFRCLPCLLPPFTVPCKMFLARPDERET